MTRIGKKEVSENVVSTGHSECSVNASLFVCFGNAPSFFIFSELFGIPATVRRSGALSFLPKDKLFYFKVHASFDSTPIKSSFLLTLI